MGLQKAVDEIRSVEVVDALHRGSKKGSLRAQRLREGLIRMVVVDANSHALELRLGALRLGNHDKKV